MSQLTDAERDQIAQAIAGELTSAAPAGAMQTEAAPPADAKNRFCENWDTAREVLTFLQTAVPRRIGGVIGLVIAAGDAAKGVICRG
jgi:hypothetical protein